MMNKKPMLNAVQKPKMAYMKKPKLNKGFDSLPKDVQNKIMKKKPKMAMKKPMKVDKIEKKMLKADKKLTQAQRALQADKVEAMQEAGAAGVIGGAGRLTHGLGS